MPLMAAVSLFASLAIVVLIFAKSAVRAEAFLGDFAPMCYCALSRNARPFSTFSLQSRRSVKKSLKTLGLRNWRGDCLRRVRRGQHPLTSPILALVGLILLLAGPVAATPTEDSYIAGYASAILELEFSVRSATVKVKDGVVTLVRDELGWQSRDKIVSNISAIRGVVRVELESRGQAGTAPPPPTGTAQREGGATEVQVARPSSVWFPRDKLFLPLLADPRWPHFSLSYLRSVGHAQFKDVASTNFGETISIFRADLPTGQWEVGIQAGVFAIFDLDTHSKNLQNADYFVGIPLTYRWKGFTALLRIFHQSSHLGDEFVLANPLVHRVNLSYEEPNLILSQEFGESSTWLRIYGGAGYLIDRDPSSLKPWTTQAGVELTSPWTFLSDAVRPLAAVDVQNNQDTDWGTNVSVVAGVQFESLIFQSTKLLLLGEYYNGHSPDGQFFQQKTQYTGFGAHFYF